MNTSANVLNECQPVTWCRTFRTIKLLISSISHFRAILISDKMGSMVCPQNIFGKIITQTFCINFLKPSDCSRCTDWVRGFTIRGSNPRKNQRFFPISSGPHRNRIPAGARFSALVETGPGAHPASYAMDTGSFPLVKLPGRGINHPPHLAPRLKKE